MKKTALNDVHRELGAKMVEFAGYEMPIQYSSIIEEHMAVRKSVGLFDVSHMGDLKITGSGSVDFISYLFTNDVHRADIGEMKYGMVCDEKGRIIDDMIVYRTGEDDVFVIPNASMVDTIYTWFSEHNDRGLKIENLSDSMFCLALQGPRAVEVLKKVAGEEVAGMEFFTFRFMDLLNSGREIMVARSGYTGEDGFELVGDNDMAREVWDALMEAGKEYSIMPVGLGARDTLRLEKGFLLSGQDFHRDRTPVEANAEWAVKWEHEFMGRDAMLAQKEGGNYELFVGIRLTDKGVPRHGYSIHRGGDRIGTVTSGTLSPMLNTGIALGYVAKEHSGPETEVEINIRGKMVKGTVVKLPFV